MFALISTRSEITTDLVVRDIKLATMAGPDGEPLGWCDDGIVAVADGRVTYAGPASNYAADDPQVQTVSMGGRMALPGLVCCHNALMWVPGVERPGWQGGVTYKAMVEETARLTCAATDEDLVNTASARLALLKRSGVTACELKTGFGLTPEDELRFALLARRLQAETDLQTSVTLYAGHFMPSGADPDAYLEEIVMRLLPEVYERQACDAVEVFCDDEGGVDLDQASTILEAFYRKKTPSRVSCDRFCDSAGATLPASFYSRSATYLCCSDEDGIASIAATGSTIVLVPGIALCDRDSMRPNIDAMRKAGVKLAISTEGGPIAEEHDLMAAARMAVSRFGITPQEALLGVTVNAAKVLGLDHMAGSLLPGRRADLAFFDVSTPDDLITTSHLRPSAVMTNGRLEDFSEIAASGRNHA